MPQDGDRQRQDQGAEPCYRLAVLQRGLENDAEYAKTSLIIAPNVIVFERLKLDFGGGRIFRADPVIPPEFKLYWDVESYMRGDSERASSQGAI